MQIEQLKTLILNKIYFYIARQLLKNLFCFYFLIQIYILKKQSLKVLNIGRIIENQLNCSLLILFNA